MFTGIIESIATIVDLQKEGSNLHVSCKSDITDELKIDQSLAHNGVCLTVVKIDGDIYTVTAIKETLEKSNLGNLDLVPRKKLNTNRVKTISANTKDYEYRLYFEAWRQKVERIGALNYPEVAKLANLGALRLTVSLNKEGNIEEVIINKTSGNKDLDEAAIKIVKLGEPYAAFSTKMQKEIDLVNITRTWKFTDDNN